MKRSDTNALHDVLYEVEGYSMSDQQIIKICNNIPEHIISFANDWGYNDTVFLDEFYEWYLKNKD